MQAKVTKFQQKRRSDHTALEQYHLDQFENIKLITSIQLKLPPPRRLANHKKVKENNRTKNIQRLHGNGNTGSKWARTTGKTYMKINRIY